MTQMKSKAELSTVVRQRRATNHFKPDPIPEELLNEILELAILAPSGYNLQPWRFIVVREEENRKKLMAAAMKQPKVAEAPVVVIVCGDTTAWRTDLDRMLEMGKRLGNIPNDEIAGKVKKAATGYLESVDANVWVTKHATIAFSFMMLLAESYGIDTAPMEGFWEDKVKAAFNIPDHLRVIALLAMGYASEPDRPSGGRFPISDLVFEETYGDGWKNGAT